MAYIESFIIYWLLVLVGGVVLFSLLVLTLSLFSVIAKIFKLKSRAVPQQNTIKKTMKIFISLYLLSMVFFYIERANTYLFSDRAYKEAKAYAIAGEYLFLWQMGVLNLSSPENIILKPINAVQNYLLKRIRTYIPQNDAEYEIWNYKFNLIQYAGTMYAPMTEESKQKGLHFTNGAASMKPQLLEILKQLFNAMQTLSQGKIKDKEFSQIDRYLVIASMAPYYERYFPYFGDLNSDTTDPKYYPKKLTAFWENNTLNKQFQTYLEIIDNIALEKEKNQNLDQAFESHPKIKASFYWGAVRGYVAYSNHEEYRGSYPCSNPNFLKFVKYYKSYVNWVYMSPKSSFKTLSKRQKKTYDFLIENQESGYYIAKYICKIPFKYTIQGEASIEPRYRQSSFSRSMEMRSGIKHIREIEKNLTQGKHNE